MKNYILAIAVLVLNLGCGSNAKKQDNKPNNKSALIQKEVSSAEPKQTDSAQKLLATTPFTEDELQQRFPETLLDTKRTVSSKGTLLAPNANGASAMYHGEGKKMVSISITDCAGEGGAKLYKQYLEYKEPKEDSENTTSITTYINKNGIEGKALYIKSLNQYALDLLYKDRLVISITAKGMELESIWEAFNSLNLEALIK
ncbi:MAG: hypothetical protein ACK5M7_02585 [Draconibacterium sp.]